MSSPGKKNAAIVCAWSWQCELLKAFFFGEFREKTTWNASEAYGYFDEYRCMISYHEWSFLLKWLLKNVRIDRNVLLKLLQSVNLNQGDNSSDGSPWLVFCANLSLGLSALKLITRAFWQAGGSNVRDTVDGRNPVIYKVLYIPGGAGFLPSTVCRSQLYKHFGCVGLITTFGGTLQLSSKLTMTRLWRCLFRFWQRSSLLWSIMPEQYP